MARPNKCLVAIGILGLALLSNFVGCTGMENPQLSSLHQKLDEMMKVVDERTEILKKVTSGEIEFGSDELAEQLAVNSVKLEEKIEEVVEFINEGEFGEQGEKLIKGLTTLREGTEASNLGIGSDNELFAKGNILIEAGIDLIIESGLSPWD